MLSWDDFRHVKAIADSGSLNGAAHALGINHSTAFRKLGQIEQRLGARLFKRERSGYTLTAAGEEMVRLAERMERDVAAFTISKDGKPARSAASGVLPAEAVMAQTLGFRLAEAAQGRAVFEGLPEFRHYNPIGSVHGGFAATLLDSALGCAIFSTLAKGESWTTLELKLNFVRAMSENTGPVRAEGRVIHRGRTVATSEGDLKDRAGKLYAHATTTCMIFPAKG